MIMWLRSIGPRLMWAPLVLATVLPARAQSALHDARDAFLEGRYEDAVLTYSRLARRDPSPAAAARGLVEVLREVGRYDEAEGAARRFINDNPASGELWNSLGAILALRGRLEEAEVAFKTARERAASDSLTARLNLTVLQYRRGDRVAAMQALDEFIDVYNFGGRRPAEELTAIATAVRYLGVADPQLYRDALRAYDEAAAAGPDDPEPRILTGELFLEKYNGTDARDAFQEVLERNPRHPRALLGLARTLRFEGSPGAMSLVGRSLEVNPNLVPARVFLATLHLEVEDYAAAAREVERALAVDPGSLEALSELAALRFLQGDEAEFRDAVRRVLAANPGYGDLYNTLAEASARNRLYEDAARFARRAVELDRRSWRGFALLGINQLRLGRMEAGRANLDTAFRGDPYDVWTKNTLDLLDTLERYPETVSPRFRFFIDGKESELLSLYFTDLAEEAYDSLVARYGYRPPTPIRVEVFPDHADFSVRTMGLVGIGALGVSFGPVVAMDSPSAREKGTFHWGSTLWHEIAHSFHLAMTGHKVPRWFTEGLAVYEERKARPGWGQNVSPGFLAAYKGGRLLPVSELNSGFMRPAFPEQLGFSYYQASLVCELIERDYGADALARMLVAYGNGMSSSRVFKTVLRTDLEGFDERFDRYVRDRFARPLAALGPASDDRHARPSRPEIERRARRDRGDFGAQLAMGRVLAAEGRLGEAIPYLERAKELFPEYAGSGSPYWHLAEVYRRQGSLGAAAAELEAHASINAGDYRALVTLVGILDTLGDSRGAARALDRALYIYPFELGNHLLLASLSADLGDWERAIRERRAILALDPVDRADALYQLALAYFGADRMEDAKRSVLRALEIAPSFAKAQDLLLEIHERG